MTDPEFALIDGIVAGNQQGFADLVNRYKQFAFTIAYKILGNKAEAEEAAQDAFIKAYHHLRNFKKDARFSTWLYRIVFNTAVSYKRRQKHHLQDIEKTIVEYQEEAGSMLERQDKRKYLDKAISQLNEADKVAITLYYLEECSLDEIAAITGIPANTTKVRIHRARIRLAEELKRILKKEAITL